MGSSSLFYKTVLDWKGIEQWSDEACVPGLIVQKRWKKHQPLPFDVLFEMLKYVDIFFCYFRFTSTNVAWESLTVFSSPGLTATTKRRPSRSTTSSTSPPSTSRTTTTTLYQNNCCCCIYHWKLFYFFNFNLYLTHRRNFCLASLPTDKLDLYLSHWRANTFAK